MNATSTTLIVVAAIVAVAFVALASMELTTSSRTVDIASGVSDSSVDDLPRDSSFGIVTKSLETEGPWFEAFGIALGSEQHTAFVMFIPPAACSVPETGDLKATGNCAGIPAEGEVSGGGTRSDSSRLVIVGVPVSKACHRELAPGDRWPTDIEACRAD
ncbi:MAG TPA: hypothetical protein VFK32_07200 [Tepidiformaceae bacterium]|nr:hypothetical protein [Tepidiformaceae bacterium]